MASGVTDKYYQFAKCFRDESSRKDRQPEFTQIDLEMAFVNGQGEPGDDSGWRIGGSEVRRVVEGMVRSIWTAAKGVDVLPDREDGSPSGFHVMTYEEAMRRFGVDKPDVRFALEIVDLATGLKKHYLKGDVEEEDGNEDDVKLMKEKAGTLEILAFRGPKAGQAFRRKEAMELTRDKSGGPGRVSSDSLSSSPLGFWLIILSSTSLYSSNGSRLSTQHRTPSPSFSSSSPPCCAPTYPTPASRQTKSTSRCLPSRSIMLWTRVASIYPRQGRAGQWNWTRRCRFGFTGGRTLVWEIRQSWGT